MRVRHKGPKLVATSAHYVELLNNIGLARHQSGVMLQRNYAQNEIENTHKVN